MEPREPDEGDGPRPDDGDPVEHLWNAAHEMLRAFRTLIDAADEFVESQRGGRPAPRGDSEPREGRVHHIDIDIDGDADADEFPDTRASARPEAHPNAHPNAGTGTA